MKKQVLFLLILLAPLSVVKAQPDFSHSIGINFAGLADDFGNSVSAQGALYVPRLNFALGDASSISLAAPVCLAFQLSSQNGSSIFFDLPISGEFNFGRLATTDNDEGFGMFLGGGLGFTVMSIGGAGASFLGWNGYLGVRALIAERPLELRLNLGGGFGDYSDISKFGLGLTYTLGME